MKATKQAAQRPVIRLWDVPIVHRLHDPPTKYMVTKYYTTTKKKLEAARDYWAQNASTYVASEWDEITLRNYRNREEETPDYIPYYYMLARFFSMYPSMTYKQSTVYLDIYKDMKRWKEKYMAAFLEKNKANKRHKEDFAVVYHDIQLVVLHYRLLVMMSLLRKLPIRDICCHILSYLL